MAVTEVTAPEKEIAWMPTLIRRLRSKRIQAGFGKLLEVPKNTVWRWKAGRVAPDTSTPELAAAERFLENCGVAGSLKFMGYLGDLEEGSRETRDNILKSIAPSARELAE